jgi:hypothetical protein
LTAQGLYVKLFDMETTVTELLRHFPKIRRAALAGQRVVIRTREGNLVLTAEKPTGNMLFGALATNVNSESLTADDSGGDAADWRPSL